eukprot:TRINITY_DN7748_c0_g1_i1.p1 TRINITY_DN7748_c0_g1~~TRINITY_DN7748_c0_g1_i1.p1  ORF type:complete len:110 (+),score=18.86 TRINITY_DN7748_c0_g1_i1:270-599(+)
MVEHLASCLTENYVERIESNFQKPPRDPNIEQSTSGHTKGPYHDLNDNNHNDNGNNNNNENTNNQSQPPQDLEKKLKLALNGALTDVTWETLYPLQVNAKQSNSSRGID